jgi:hypothetical protein
MKGILEVAPSMVICSVECVSAVVTGMVTSVNVRETLRLLCIWMRLLAEWTITLKYAQDLVYVNVASVLATYAPIQMRWDEESFYDAVFVATAKIFTQHLYTFINLIVVFSVI